MRGRPHFVRAALAGACLLLLVALLAPAVAGADLLTPEAGPTKNAVDTDTLYKIVLVLGLIVIGSVWAALFYALFRFRARRGRVPTQISGNTALELGWTAAASAIVIGITIVTYVFLDDIRDPAPSGPASVAEARTQYAATNQPPPPGGKGIEVQVSGQQYLWRYQYPNGTFSFQEMVVPRDTTVVLKIKANDVAHSWWIPQLGGKMDAIPGYLNKSWFQVPIDKLDDLDSSGQIIYEGQCAELCGRGHADMLARVIALPFDKWKAWYDRKADELQTAKDEAAKERKQINAEEGQ
jgi:cytochrome c oxidase subunit II